MGPSETATATPGGPRVIDVFDGTGAPSGPNCTLFSGGYRPVDVSRGRPGCGQSPAPLTPSTRQSSALREALKQTLDFYC